MSKLIELFNKETSYKNESVKMRKVVRYLLLFSVLFSAIETVYDAICYDFKGILFCVGIVVIFDILFVLSYYLNARKTLTFTMAFWILWLFMQVGSFGRNIGSQQFIVIMVIVGFFCSYVSLKYKVMHTLSLLLVSVGLYVFGLIMQPLDTVPPNAELVMQILTSLGTYSMVGVICFIYGNENQAQEKKLVTYNIQLENEANTDALTGLVNRRRIRDIIEKIYKSNDPLGYSVAMCDIDFFKKVNDNYGHDVGDEVLKRVAQTLSGACDEGVSVSRWGGEEFLVVFDKMNGDEAFVYLQDMLNRVRALEFNIADRSFRVTMTMGLAEFDFKSDVDTMIKQADEKMYHGKENGRNQIVF